MNKKFITFITSLAAAASLYAAGPAHAHWGYKGDVGPNHWGSMSHSYAMCGLGQNQSPVNIQSTVTAKLPAIAMNYKAPGKDFVNNGHTVEVAFDKGDTIMIDGKPFKLLQFHFHTPSENTIDHKHYPMEAHLVHRGKDGHLAVVAVFFKKGKANPGLAKLVAHMPKNHGQKIDLKGVKITAADILPKDKSYYRYDGSLTTPPCSEGVRWIVLKTPVEASAAQLKAFEKVLNHNNRPTQPLNARLILQ